MYNSIMGSVKSGHIQWYRDVYQIKQKRQSPHLHSSSQQRFVSQALSYMPRIHPLVKTGDNTIYHVNEDTQNEYRKYPFRPWNVL